MSLTIHVYIATNKGLVAIQNITDLQDGELQSVITLNGSTDIASVSAGYHRFVQKSTGLIQREFGGASYRANISRNIDQGNSWQLPFYLAHLIQSHSNHASSTDNSHASNVNTNKLSLGQGAVKSGDIVFIATGQINTSTKAIDAVSQVPEKCITASAQIKLWMKSGILVEFFVPAKPSSAAVKQQGVYDLPALLPEIDCAIYPVVNLAQLQQHIEQLVPVIAPVVATKSSARIGKPISVQSDQPTSLTKSVTQSETMRSSLVTLLGFNFRGLTLLIAALIISVVIIYLWSTKSAGHNEIRFISQTKSHLHCDADQLRSEFDIAQQFVTRLPALTLQETCNLTLATALGVPQVWLVADTKTLIELSADEVNQQRHWHIPLPSQQQISREYTLIVTHEYLDLADLAAFKSYLSRLSPQQKPSVEILAVFFNQINVNPQYISQQLVVPEV